MESKLLRILFAVASAYFFLAAYGAYITHKSLLSIIWIASLAFYLAYRAAKK